MLSLLLTGLYSLVPGFRFARINAVHRHGGSGWPGAFVRWSCFGLTIIGMRMARRWFGREPEPVGMIVPRSSLQRALLLPARVLYRVMRKCGRNGP